MKKNNSICVKVTGFLTIDNLDKEFMKNLGSLDAYELSEDQEDEIRYVASEILPQSGNFDLKFGSGTFFFELDEMEVEEVN